jgi:antitoxin (DNA-binding transcriptional repressor) of toxin-antitoxin stability system
MPKEVIHTSEAEAASNFASLLARVCEGAEIVIEIDARPVAVVRPAESTGPGRLLSESIVLAEAHGSTVTLDGDFGRDLEDIINSHREPLTPPEWD